MLEKKLVQEGIYSVVDPELVKPDVKSQQKRRNDKEFHDRILERFLQLLEKDSYWVSGIDILPGDNSPQGQFKPDTPFCDHKSLNSSFMRLIQVIAQYFSINKALGFTPATEGGKADA